MQRVIDARRHASHGEQSRRHVRPEANPRRTRGALLKADIQVDTAGRTFEESLEILIQTFRDTPVRESLAPAVISR